MRAIAAGAVVLYHAHFPGLRGGYVGVDAFFVISGFLITTMLWDELAARGRLSLPQFYARRARRLLPAATIVLIGTTLASAALLSPLAAKHVFGDAIAATFYVANIRFAATGTNYLADQSTPSPLQHYWSLGAEEQFYLVWPVLMALVCGAWLWRKPSRRATLLALTAVTAGSFVLSLWLTSAAEPWAFFSFPTRAWQLGLGGLVALSTPALARLPGVVAAILGWLGLGALLLAMVAFTQATPFPGTAALVPALGCAAVIAAGRGGRERGAVRVLRVPILQAGGEISYSWYLWHYPVLILGAAALGHGLGWFGTICAVAVSVLLAALTTRVVEQPFRRSVWLGFRARRSLVLGGSLMATTTAVVVIAGAMVNVPTGTGIAPTLNLAAGSAVVAPHAASGIGARRAATRERAATSSAPPTSAKPSETPSPPSPHDAAATTYHAIVSQLAAAVAQSAQLRVVPANLQPSLRAAHADFARPFVDGCFDNFVDNAVHPCVYGDKTATTTIVVFGDSHATQWEPAFNTIATQHDWRLQVWGKATCPPLLTSLVSPALGHEYAGCEQWRNQVLSTIKAEHPKLVVLGMSRWYGPVFHLDEFSSAWMSGLSSMIARIRDDGVPVAVMGPIEHPIQNVPNCLAAHPTNVAACDEPASQALNRAGVANERTAVIAAGGSYIDPSPWMCTATTCDAIVGNLLAFRDDNHLSATFATSLAPILDAALQAGGVLG